MRQQGDIIFQDIFLREGTLTTSHIATLLPKNNLEPSGPFAIHNALRIYPTKKQADDHNTSVLQYYKQNNTQTFHIKAQDNLIDPLRKLDDKTTIEDIISKDINKTWGLPQTLEIFTGAKVMLRTNVDISKGLVNGAIGKISEIIMTTEDINKISKTNLGTRIIKHHAHTQKMNYKQ